MWGSFPSPAARGSGTRVRGAVSSQDFARPAVMPRYFPNFRPPCRTRKSIRPAPCRVSDRTMVRLARTATLGIRPVRIRQASQGDKGTMRKKTAQPRRKPRKTSVSEKKKGLIAQKKTTGSSERAKSALDNRSHRTSCALTATPGNTAGTTGVLVGWVRNLKPAIRRLEPHLGSLPKGGHPQQATTCLALSLIQATASYSSPLGVQRPGRHWP